MHGKSKGGPDFAGDSHRVSHSLRLFSAGMFSTESAFNYVMIACARDKSVSGVNCAPYTAFFVYSFCVIPVKHHP